MAGRTAATTAGALSLGSAGIWGATKLAGSGSESTDPIQTPSNEPKITFNGASDIDKEVLNSNSVEWKYEIKENSKTTIEVRAKIGSKENAWICTLRGFVSTPVDGKNSKLEEQAKTLLSELKTNENSRKIFVENCSLSRSEFEKKTGFKSLIELEMEIDSGKHELKELEKVYGESGFRGLKKLNDLDESTLLNPNLTIEEKANEGKIIIKYKDYWSCSIAGNPPSGGLGGSKFDNEKLNTVLKNDPPSTDKITLIENCVINDKEITGLTIEKTSDSKWKFKDLEEKLLKKIYKNPNA